MLQIALLGTLSVFFLPDNIESNLNPFSQFLNIINWNSIIENRLFYYSP